MLFIILSIFGMFNGCDCINPMNPMNALDPIRSRRRAVKTGSTNIDQEETATQNALSGGGPRKLLMEGVPRPPPFPITVQVNIKDATTGCDFHKTYDNPCEYRRLEDGSDIDTLIENLWPPVQMVYEIQRDVQATERCQDIKIEVYSKHIRFGEQTFTRFTPGSKATLSEVGITAGSTIEWIVEHKIIVSDERKAEIKRHCPSAPCGRMGIEIGAVLTNAGGEWTCSKSSNRMRIWSFWYHEVAEVICEENTHFGGGDKLITYDAAGGATTTERQAFLGRIV